MIYAIILLAAATRFIPHLPNFAPITALAIFSGAYLSTKKAVGITFAARLISDLILGFFAWPLMLAVYAAHLLGVFFGIWIKKSQQAAWPKIIGSSLSASLLFFLITNFAWFYPQYGHNFSGIIQSYVSGLPFLRGTLLGDLVYTVGLFGSYQLARFFLQKRQNVAN